MNFVAKHWAFLRTWTLVDWVWRGSLLGLPWQTRWFLEAPFLEGFPWEQGRISVYASMLLMLALVALVAYRDRVWERCSWKRIGGIVLVGIFLAFPTLSWAATGQWMVQGTCLFAWGWALTRSATRKEFGRFTLYALLPVAVFGVWQAFAQSIPASTLFGVAAQDPARLGVSVIQAGTRRFLRAYGAFPHPNIFGGWMMLALLLAWSRSMRERGLLFMLPLFSLALYLSFSRSAWLALMTGACVLVFTAWKTASIRGWFLGAALISLTFGAAALVSPELLFTRLQTSARLEVKSINERVVSLEQGWRVAHLFPFGTGLGAYRVGLTTLCAAKGCAVPTEPPHAVPALALGELGVLRASVLLTGLGFLLIRFRRRAFTLLPIAVLACFDHYLWSLWAGQTLCVLIVLTAPGAEGKKQTLALVDHEC